MRDLKQELGTTAPVFLWKTINPGHYDCDSASSAIGPVASFEAYQAEVLRHPASDLPVSDRHRYWSHPLLLQIRPCCCPCFLSMPSFLPRPYFFKSRLSLVATYY